MNKKPLRVQTQTQLEPKVEAVVTVAAHVAVHTVQFFSLHCTCSKATVIDEKAEIRKTKTGVNYY